MDTHILRDEASINKILILRNYPISEFADENFVDAVTGDEVKPVEDINKTKRARNSPETSEPLKRAHIIEDNNQDDREKANEGSVEEESGKGEPLKAIQLREEVIKDEEKKK